LPEGKASARPVRANKSTGHRAAVFSLRQRRGSGPGRLLRQPFGRSRKDQQTRRLWRHKGTVEYPGPQGQGYARKALGPEQDDLSGAGRGPRPEGGPVRPKPVAIREKTDRGIVFGLPDPPLSVPADGCGAVRATFRPADAPSDRHPARAAHKVPRRHDQGGRGGFGEDGAHAIGGIRRPGSKGCGAPDQLLLCKPSTTRQ